MTRTSRPARRRFGALRLLAVAAVAGIGGCSPLLPLLGAALGGGDSSRPVVSGPFGGAPSSVQNRRPSDSTISDTLASVDDQIKPACQAQLPPPPDPPQIGCSLRPVCLPGAAHPMRMRVCGETASRTATPVAGINTAGWLWAED